jgi:hypothetical protein
VAAFFKTKAQHPPLCLGCLLHWTISRISLADYSELVALMDLVEYSRLETARRKQALTHSLKLELSLATVTLRFCYVVSFLRLISIGKQKHTQA